MNEVNEGFVGTGIGSFGVGLSCGEYRDATVKWLGSAADRVMGDTELPFDKKKEALDELIRMVDEEVIISDGDRATFEGKYLKDTRNHRQVQ